METQEEQQRQPSRTTTGALRPQRKAYSLGMPTTFSDSKRDYHDF